jgi:hypothetical protein
MRNIQSAMRRLGGWTSLLIIGCLIDGSPASGRSLPNSIQVQDIVQLSHLSGVSLSPDKRRVVVRVDADSLAENRTEVS